MNKYAEDLDANLRLVEQLAPIHCTLCHGYHLARARKRLAAPEALDRPEIVALIRDRVTRRGAEQPFEVLIAGSADSNLLAMAAEAVADTVPAHYTVLDRCWTPLAVCDAYARRCDLAVQTRQVDMGAPTGAFAADVIVVHSLLRFLPEEHHLGALRALRGWLKPGGAVIFSHRLIDSVSEPFYRAEYDAPAPILALVAKAGLRVVSLRHPNEENGPRRRLLALLGAA